MSLDTSWSLIDGAAGGNRGAREVFSRRYLPVVRAYLAARWRGSARHLEDAVQEVFLRCFRVGGALARADRTREGGFQAYLYGVTRKVALEFEARDARSAAHAASSAGELDELPGDGEHLSQIFDRAFARTLMREAGELMRARADADGEEALRRVELLRLRFEGGHKIGAIAERWGADPARLHHEYARAREEFHRALLGAAAVHLPGRTPAEVEAHCARLLEMLS